MNILQKFYETFAIRKKYLKKLLEICVKIFKTFYKTFEELKFIGKSMKIRGIFMIILDIFKIYRD